MTEGYRPGDFEAIAINASPCGGCRQWLYEMGFDRVVFRNRGEVVTMSPAELLPESFELDAASPVEGSARSRRCRVSHPCGLRR